MLPASEVVRMVRSGCCVALSDGGDQLWPVSHPRRIMPRQRQNAQLQPGRSQTENILNRLVPEVRVGRADVSCALGEVGENLLQGVH
jgi:hypothetical protein